MKTFLNKLSKLIDVKSIISLATTFVFCRLALKEVVSEQVFISVYSIIIGFYFGTQYSKVKSVLDNTTEINTNKENKEE